MTQNSLNAPSSSVESSFYSSLIPTANRNSIWLFLLVNFLWWVGLYIYVPILPVYIQEAGAGLDMVGAVLSAYAVPQILLRVPLGLWADRLGRRKHLVAGGIVFTSLGALGLGLAASPWTLFLSRLVTGVGAAAWLAFPIYFLAYYPAGASGKAIGLINFIRSIALIAATAAGGFIAEAFGVATPFILASLLGIFALGALLLTQEVAHRPAASARRNSWKVATRPLLLVVSLMAILMHFAVFAGVFGFIPIYAARIGATSSQLGLMTMVNLVFSAMGALAAIWMSERAGYRLTTIICALVAGASLFVIPLSKSVPVLMVVQAGFGLGSGVLMTLFMVLCIHGVPREQQATAMGVFQAIYAIGMLAGPLTSGFVGSGAGLAMVFYVAAGFVLMIALLAFLPVFSKKAIG